MEIRIRKASPLAVIPTRGSEKAAGYDLYAAIAEPVVIHPHETVMIDTGLQIEIPDGYFGAVVARSGLAVKENLRPENCIGVVDSDYRGNWFIGLHNDGLEDRTIVPQERIAQMIVVPYLSAEFVETDTLSETERGAGGFGSTGK